MQPVAVDESPLSALPLAVFAPPARWFGVVVAKRHARRSVTRSLLKREMRAGFARQAERLARGLWVVRLRAPFEPAGFPSAASSALRGAARDELEALFSAAAQTRGIADAA